MQIDGIYNPIQIDANSLEKLCSVGLSNPPGPNFILQTQNPRVSQFLEFHSWTEPNVVYLHNTPTAWVLYKLMCDNPNSTFILNNFDVVMANIPTIDLLRSACDVNQSKTTWNWYLSQNYPKSIPNTSRFWLIIKNWPKKIEDNLFVLFVKLDEIYQF